jgi:hypothetical protein
MVLCSRYGRASGRELLYQTSTGQLMTVEYAVKGESFSAGRPTFWVERRLGGMAGGRNFDLIPDGKQIVASAAREPRRGDANLRVTFLVNVTDDLRQRVRTRRQK